MCNRTVENGWRGGLTVQPPVEQLQILRRFLERVERRIRKGRDLEPERARRLARMAGFLQGVRVVDFAAMSDGQLAHAFGRCPRVVLDWHKKGLPMNPDKTHNLAKCFRWYLLRDRARRTARRRRPRIL